jgi:SAM-dependent methyltransferase
MMATEIARTADAESQRVFAFDNPDQLRDSFLRLTEHAAHYKVRAIRRERLSLHQRYNRDFSIIEVAGSKVLAYYDEGGYSKVICFSADREEVERYESGLDRIWHDAKPVAAHDDVQQVVERVFPRARGTGAMKKHVEMSEYINTELYDLHEEEHAYYPEMMAKMLAVFEAGRARERRPRLLEFGAGTGIFTRRLAQLPNVEVFAVEFDIVCFNRMVHRFHEAKDLSRFTREDRDDIRRERFEFKNGNEVVCINQDSCKFDPGGPEVRFDAVFSSFADHHITEDDKQMYLDNVRNNLSRGSPFIVGDEFLPPYDPRSEAQLQAALRTYHGHIIDIARKAGHQELVKLETDALNSGLERKGDFKVSCALYEEALREAEMRWDPPIKIGPLDAPADVGGIYVYRIWDPKNS